MQSTISTANLGQQAVRLNITRALSRLKSVFLTLISPPVATVDAANLMGLKEWNNFYSPMRNRLLSSKNHFDSDGEFEYQIQLGSKMYPVYPVRSHAEAFSQLSKTMGIYSHKSRSFDIDSADYRSWKFICGIDMEKVIEAGFTGMNTRAGDILNVQFTHKDTVAANYAVGMHIVLHADCIMEIRDSGVEVSM